jgi:GT2 family glycosyltransferase
MCKLSVIIVNYNTRDLVCQCIGSLINHGPAFSFEVILVDNASNDGSCDDVESKFPSVRIIRNTHNVGFSAANNQGLAIAQGELVALLNSDTIVTPGSLDTMCDAFAINDRVGVVAPKLVYPDGSLQMSYGPIPNLFAAFCSFLDLKSLVASSTFQRLGRSRWTKLLGKTTANYADWFSGDQPPTRILQDNLLASGACLLIRRQCLEEVGHLDPNIFMYCDDADYCQRVHDKGWKILYLAEATIIHIKGGTAGQDYRWTSPRSYESTLYFFRKHRGWAIFQLARCIALLSLSLRWAVHSIADREKASASWNLFRQVARYSSSLPRTSSASPEVSSRDITGNDTFVSEEQVREQVG